MFQAHSIGRLFGVEVRVHGTVLALAAGVALLSLFSSGLAGAAEALLLLLAVFGSVTLHELGHVGASALFGGRTLGVTLYPFGGVAQLDRESRSGAEEVVVALAGPAVNFALAGLAALPLLLLGAGEPFGTLLGVNLALGLFNLTPAYPMDGGRVLRGGLWGWLGWRRATELAARAGRWFALGFAVLGLVWSPMLLVIALFVFLQASAELARVRLGAPEPGRAAAHESGVWRHLPAGQGLWRHPRPGRVQVLEDVRVIPRSPSSAAWVVEQVETPWGTMRRWSLRG
jgi:stage IV sporulation protein FB